MRNQNHLIDLIQFIHLSDAYDLLIQLIYIICLESFSPEPPVSPDLPDPDLFDSTDPHYACCSPFLPHSPDQPSPPHVNSPRCSVQSNITVEIYTLRGGRGNLGKQTDTIGTTRAFSLQNLKCDTKPDLSPENQISINTSLQILLVVSTTGL